MKTIKLLTAVLTLVIAFTFAANAADNSTSTASGTFTATVGQALLVAVDITPIDLGTVVPGATKSFEANNAMTFTVTGQADVPVILATSAVNNNAIDIAFAGGWYQQVEGVSTLMVAPPTSGLGAFTYKVTSITAPKDATPENTATLTVTMTANYATSY
jgi:hypothetical protein